MTEENEGRALRFIQRVVRDADAARFRVADARAREIVEALYFDGLRLLGALDKETLSPLALSEAETVPAPPDALDRECARTLRAAADAALARDKARGWYPDGPAELLCDLADAEEADVFGPVGLRGLDG